MVIQVALKNKANESASILDDSVLQRYTDSIQSYNSKLKQVLGKYAQSNRILTNSSPFMQVHLADSGLLPGDARLATRNELETAVARSNEFLRGVYTDFGIALFTAGDSYKPNDLPAKVLAEQLKQRGIELGKGKLVPLAVLTLQEDGNSEYGGVFRLNDKASKENISDLGAFNWNWSRGEGMACAHLDGGSVWDADVRDLDLSGGSGRVVVVSGEATSRKILETHVNNFRQEKATEIAQIQKKYAEREALLRAE